MAFSAAHWAKSTHKHQDDLWSDLQKYSKRIYILRFLLQHMVSAHDLEL